MALTAYITTAGQAAIADAQIFGYKIDLVRFKLGNTLITATDPATIRAYSTLPGTIVYDSGNNPTDMSLTAQLADAGGVVVKIHLNTTIGDFTLGSAGLYLSDGTLFAILKLDNAYTKVKNSGSLAGNTITFPFVFTITVQDVLNLSILAESVAAFPIVSTQSELPSYDVAPYANYFVQEFAGSGRSAIACRFATEWQFCLASQQGLFEGWVQVASSDFDSGIANGDAVYYNISTSKWSLLDGLGSEKPSIGVRQGNGVRIASLFYKENSYLAGTKYYIDSYPSLGKLTTLETNYYLGTAITSSILSINPSYIDSTIVSNTADFQYYHAAIDSNGVYNLTNDTGEYPASYYDGQVIQFIAPASSSINQQVRIGTDLPSVYINQGSAQVTVSSGIPLSTAGLLPAGSLITLTYLNVDSGFRVALTTPLWVSPITIANNATDANNDIDFSAGVFQFSDGSGRAIATAMTKRLDANWAAGTNQGGLDTGSKTAVTWYHCYAIYNPTTQASDFLFSTGATAPTALPSGFTKYKWVGAVLNNSGNNINPFIQDGKTITYNAVLIYDSPAIPTTPTAASCITPPGIRVKGLFYTTFDTSAQVFTNLIYTDPIKTSFSRIVAAGTPFNAGSNFEAFTDFSTYIFLSKSDANALDVCKVYNYGWEIPDNLY